MAGGDISEAFRLDLDDGRSAFLKHHARPPEGMFEAEAFGLRWLAEAAAVRVPEVWGTGEDFLVLEWMEPRPPTPAGEAALGQALARLHRSGAPRWGGVPDNYVGTLAQANGPCESWAEFYVERRLAPLTRRARDAGYLDARDVDALEAIMDRIDPDWVGAERPARLHGDLWAGNHLYLEGGEPALIDPAVYGGHREVDLAMMRLFGGFGARVFDAYTEVWPLAPEAKERVELYQLYPLLVHVCLFGRSYRGRLMRAAARYG